MRAFCWYLLPLLMWLRPVNTTSQLKFYYCCCRCKKSSLLTARSGRRDPIPEVVSTARSFVFSYGFPCRSCRVVTARRDFHFSSFRIVLHGAFDNQLHVRCSHRARCRRDFLLTIRNTNLIHTKGGPGRSSPGSHLISYYYWDSHFLFCITVQSMLRTK